MSEDIQEIERLIKQSTELSDSLTRLARKLQQQNKGPYQELADGLGALHAKLTDLHSYIDIVKREIGPQRHYYTEGYAKARQAVAQQTATPQEAGLEVLRTAVADKTMTPEAAAEWLVKLLPAHLPASRKIEIRQTAKASLEAGDDIAGKIRPFLKNPSDQAEQKRNVNKRVFDNAPGQRM
jgi:hypothetical protein